MRVVLIIIAVAILGAGFGVTQARTSYKDPGPDFESFLANPLPIENVIEKVDAAKLVVVNGEDYDFGTMDLGETQEYAFIFRNEGTRPLTLGTPKTTCMCMLPELASGGIPPGESREVILKWTPRKHEYEFHQSAAVPTSDPHRGIVTLVVYGSVLPRAKSMPATLSVGSITTETSREMETIIYGYQSNVLEVMGTEWIRPELKDFFEVDFRPATTEELEREVNARAAVVCKLKLKQGLPLGAVEQRLVVDLKTDKRSRIDIPIIGEVVGDISITGNDYQPKVRVLDLGFVKQEIGKKATLIMAVKGEHRADVKPTIKRLDPEGTLTATFDAPVKSNKASIHILRIMIPPDSPLANRLGNNATHPSGKILIETNHPTIPEIEVKVSFAVAE